MSRKIIGLVAVVLAALVLAPVAEAAQAAPSAPTCTLTALATPGTLEVSGAGMKAGGATLLRITDRSGAILYETTFKGDAFSDLITGVAESYYTAQFLTSRESRSKCTTAAAADWTPPTINLAFPTDGARYPLSWHADANYTCADGGSVASCVGDVPNGSKLPWTLGLHSFTVTATDWVGLTTTQTVTYEVYDAVAPWASIYSPVDGQVISQGSPVTARYECGDDASGGIASCVGDVPNGEFIDTSTLGLHTFTVTATDIGGNVTVASVGYEVVA